MKRLREGQIVYGRHGREYTIRLVKHIKSSRDDLPKDWDVYGQLDRTTKVIRIRAGIDPLDQYMFLLHELIHDHAEDFEEYDLGKEFFVALFSGELFDCLRRNGLGFQ